MKLVTSSQSPVASSQSPARKGKNWRLETGDWRLNKGFTLIEVLVAVSLLGIVTATTTSLLLSSLRASQKSQALVEIKQSGDYAIKTISRMIRNAREISDYSPTLIRLENPDGGETEFRCEIGQNRIASNSASLTVQEENILLRECLFSYTPGTDIGEPDSVTVSFTLRKTAGGPIAYDAEMDFQTTASLRTY